MSTPLSIAIYFIIWWLVLFAVLPWGVRTQDESGETVPGTPGSAPSAPQLIKKMLITTVVAGLVFLLVRWVITSGVVRLNDIPTLSR